jgi:DNA-binding transcriptional MerR regulator
MHANGELFFDRTLVIHEIAGGALAPQPASFSLVGPRLSGKSTLLHWLATAENLRSALPATDPVITPLVILVDCTWATPDDLFAHSWQTLSPPTQALVEADPVDSFQRLWQTAQQLATTQQRLVLLLDNFDTLWHDQPPPADLCAQLRRLTTVATVVVATTQPLADLDAPGERRAWGELPQLFLGLLDGPAAQAWLAHYQHKHPGLAPVAPELATLTGCHPYLLRQLGVSLAEVQHMLAGQPLASHHLALIRLRLAEHARPLFTLLWQQVETQVGPLQPMLGSLLDRLVRGPLPVEQGPREQTPALNWLINQAAISYRVQQERAAYQLFSPLLADFVLHQRQTAGAVTPPSVPAPPSSEQFYEQLSKMEAALLRYFEKHSQRLVTMEQLLAEVWKRPASSTRRVQEAIRRLRLQLEQQTPPIGAIENERGRGYRFIPAYQ